MLSDNLHLVKYWDGLESKPFDPKTAIDSITSVVDKCFSHLFKVPNEYLPVIRLAVHKMNVYLNKNGVQFLPTDIKRRDKNAPDLAEMSLAAGIMAGFPENERKYDIILHACLIALLMIRRDETTRRLRLYSSTSNFLEVYNSVDSCFFGLTANDCETALLKRYANCMIVAKEVIIAKQNKERLMNICACLNEGTIYITGSGEKLETTRRVKIYENETGLLRIPRAARSMQPIPSPISSAVLSNRFLTSNSCHGLDFPCKQFIDSIMNVLSVVHGLININIIPKKMSLRKADTATPGMPMLQSEKKQFVEIVLLTTVDGCFLEAGSIKEVVETVGHVDKEYIVQNVITCNKKMTAYLPHLAEIDTFNEFGSSIWLPAHDMNTSKGKDQLSSRNNSSVPQSSVIPCSQLPAIGVDSSNSISRGTLGGSLPQPSSDGLHPQFTPSFNWDHGFGFAASTNSGSIGSLAPSNNNKITILASKRYRTEAKSSISMVKCIACSTNGLFLETTSGKSTSQHTSLETTEDRLSKKRKTDQRQMQVLDANFLSVRTPISVANVSQAPFYSYIPSTLYMGGPAPAVGGGTSSTFTSEGFFPTSTSHAAVNASSTFQSLPMSMSMSMPPSVVVPSLASSMNDVNAASTVLESFFSIVCH